MKKASKASDDIRSRTDPTSASPSKFGGELVRDKSNQPYDNNSIPSASPDEPESPVEERTVALRQAIERLKDEIADLRRAEQTMKLNEWRYRTVVETANQGIWLLNSLEKTTDVNSRMADVLGYSREEILGKKFGDFLAPGPAAEKQSLRRYDDAGDIQKQHFLFLRKDGSYLWTVVTTNPIYDDSGSPQGLVAMVADSTPRKKIEPEIRADDEFPSPAMRNTLAKARLAAVTDSIILLLGESGVGKDYLARHIHDHSKRANGPFFAVNCAAVTPELAESELFGHESGAYTGAAGKKRGLLELAEGGTLLLNEIGELSLRLQAKLLTFLDTRSFTRVGGERSIAVNARLIAATNRDLEKEVSTGSFRSDLFYRLNVLSITVPPLRERLEDLSVLAQNIVEQLAAEIQAPHVPAIDHGTINALSNYDWPGNVRELRNVLERALILSGKGSVSVSPLGLDAHLGQRDWTYTVGFPSGRNINDSTDDFKRTLILEALRRSGGSKQTAADLLGISRFALFRMMKSLGLTDLH